MIVNVHDAKTRLSQLLARAEAGEEVVIARAGRPVARLVALAPPAARRPGLWTGRMRVDDAALLAPLTEDELGLWE
jgi:prevent-host-death family protein